MDLWDFWPLWRVIWCLMSVQVCRARGGAGGGVRSGRPGSRMHGGSGCLEVHVPESQPLGTVVYNASLGQGWSYSFDKRKSSFHAGRTFSLEPSQGLVVLQDVPTCANLLHNPFVLYINSRQINTNGFVNYTQLPLTVFLHGQDCTIDYHKHRATHSVRSWSSKSLHMHHSAKSNAQLISVQLQTNFGACLPKHTVILTVEKYLASSIRRCGEVSYELHPESSSDFAVNRATGDLTVRGHMCFFSVVYRIQGRVHVAWTRDLQPYALPLDIMLYTNDQRSEVHFSGNPRGQSSSSRQRLKRESPNAYPSFPVKLYVENVPEEQAAGYVINTIVAEDSDSGDAGRITYSLLATLDGRSQNMFAIDPASGQLTTTQKLDRENIPTHYFQIIATDHGTPPRSADTSLTIYVTDANDHAPTFESDLYARSVSESVRIGATILTIRASDKDIGSNAEIEYSILNPAGANEAFRIDPRVGSIITKAQLDREQHTFYQLNILASDKALVTERKTATAVVEITVLDENDNKPQFSKTSYTVDVREDVNPSGHPVIAEITATDDDDGPNGMVRYSITGGNHQDTFTIDAITGQLAILQPLDYERTPQFRLHIRAQDSGSPYKSNSTTVLIRVIDVNDNEPVFYNALYQESVLESEPVGYTVTRITAYDADSGPNSALIYSLRNAPADMPIEIDSNTGALTLGKQLDREQESRYSFQIEARDQGDPPKTATANIEITVRDVNDNAPVFSPKVYNEVVSEEAMPGTPVVEVTARDTDENARVTYNLEEGNLRGSFSIDSRMGQGVIRVARILNYQEQSRYIITVKASDGHLVDMATVFINISDANTYRPRFQDSPYRVQVSEDMTIGSSVFKVQATDGDVGENARIVYTMEDHPCFQIDPVSGDITIKKALDRETMPSVTLSVTATDHGRPPKSDTTDVEIEIVDVNDNYPKFLTAAYSGRVAENVFVGTSILTVTATDEDAGRNGMVRYTFEGGNSGGGYFRIDPTLGILRSAKQLDREKVSHYELRAFAVDRGSPERSTSVVINLDVEDVNDNEPQFETSNIDLFIRENSPPGSTVDKIEAIDPDNGANAEVDYSIVGGPDADSFSLTTRQKEPAVITTLIELDYEGGQRIYTIVVRARSYHLFSDATVKIHVQDVNDNVPQMVDFVIVFNNYKDHFPSTAFGRIPAHDPDEYDELKYRIVSGNQANYLHLDEQSGWLRLDSRLNSDVPTNATLTVSVSDGINEVKRQCRLFVRLVTEEMLTNSTTVRLRNIDNATFLSVPIYDMFVSALASIVPTTEENIFIINVQDDTEVVDRGHRILNVSFAVRERVQAGSRHDDVFYRPQFLREKVYLKRTQLTKLSTLEVLPFDDNLCLMEPCPNFEECLVIQGFGNATNFIHSPTMLFRPIHPTQHFRCQCPTGFTGMKLGYSCDVEVNLCYSNPCGGNGTCIQREGGYTCQCNDGFTGTNCSLDMQSTKLTQCPADVCHHGSRCIPLIRGGFRCERCPHGEDALHCQDCSIIPHNNQFCQLQTRGFPDGSFIMFPSLKRRYRFHIRLSFATREKEALLFYNGRYNEKHDFVAMEIIDGQVQFSFSKGSDVTRVKPMVQGGVNDGNWHEVNVHYHNGTATVAVGEWCDTELAIKHGRQIGNYSCAARVTQQLEERCVDPTAICHRFLDLTGPFQLGGVPSLPTHFQVHNKQFVGCIRDVYVDDKFLDLNDFVYNNRTREGCEEKKSHCQSAPCLHAGTCYEAWDSYLCRCEEGYGGKDCSLNIEKPRHINGDGFLAYTTHGLASIMLPWYNALSFRTRQQSALLMSIEVGTGTKDNPKSRIQIQMVNGYLQYIQKEKTLVLDDVQVNDGDWHYLETRWTSDRFYLTLDYGQIQRTDTMGDWVVGQPVGKIYVGGLEQKIGADVVVRNGFKGCIENILVGNSPNSLLTRARVHNVEWGCAVSDVCANFPCPSNSYCNDEWERHTCTCKPGFVGAKCDKVCDSYNPCQHGSSCVSTASTSDGYTCECSKNHTGQYCEQWLHQVCPADWWGSPICGPCNCPVHNGFDSDCNKTTGECYCREHHYRPLVPETGAVSDTCLPCDCYQKGSINATCDPITGQCHCKEGVTGRRCHTCPSKYAEVTLLGCKVIYDACPEGFGDGILWRQTPHNTTASQACPSGALGRTTRFCGSEKESWWEPDLTPCMSKAYLRLSEQLAKIESGSLRVNAFVAKNLLAQLNAATAHTVDQMFLQDINVSQALVQHVLAFEAQQTGLNLTHTQDRNFIQNIVNSISRVMDPANKRWWSKINNQTGGAAGELLDRLEEYSVTLGRNMPRLFMQPVDFVSPNMVLGLDYILPDNSTVRPNVTLPKYNNKVQNPAMFDKSSQVYLPMQLVKATPKTTGIGGDSKVSDTVVTYMLLSTMGDQMPDRYDDSVVTQADVRLSVNAPVFTLNILNSGVVARSSGQHPLQLRLKQGQLGNRTSPQCVYWKAATDNGGSGGSSGGMWSTEGCRMVGRSEVVVEDCVAPKEGQCVEKYVTCQCDHLSSYTVLMYVSNQEYAVGMAVSLQVVTYVGISVSLLCLAVAFVMFCCLRSLNSNAITIHINLIFTILVVHLVFLVGISKTDPRIACKVVAITLHYFYMCTFAWMFVETLHLYRRMTEIRNINQGSMKFYYVMGYVIPGIIVGLAVGLDTDKYGNSNFCWLRTSDLLIWSFAGPICCVIAVNLVVVLMALRASCQSKKADPDFSVLKYGVKVTVVLVPLLGVAWVFGLLSVNDDVLAFHYLFAVFSCLQGLFILLAYVVFCKETRQQLSNRWQRLKGKQELDESLNGTRASMLSRSALAYHTHDSQDGGLSRFNIGVSTTSTTSRSTSKSSGALYRPEGYLHTTSSTSTSGNIPSATDYPPNAGIPPYGFDPSMMHGKAPRGDPDTGEKRRKRRDSDSDSEMSAVEHPDMELASSHSSDDDDDDNYQWGKAPKKHQPKSRSRGRKTGPRAPAKPSISPPQSSPHVAPSTLSPYSPNTVASGPERSRPPPYHVTPQKPTLEVAPRHLFNTTPQKPPLEVTPRHSFNTTPQKPPLEFTPRHSFNTTPQKPPLEVTPRHSYNATPQKPPLELTYQSPCSPSPQKPPLDLSIQSAYTSPFPTPYKDPDVDERMSPPCIPPRPSVVSPSPVGVPFNHSAPPPPYNSMYGHRRQTPPHNNRWPRADVYSNSNDIDIKSPNHVKLSPRSPIELRHSPGDKDIISPPERIDSLPSPKGTPTIPDGDSSPPPKSPKDRVSVTVLTHNGSLSESDVSNETTV